MALSTSRVLFSAMRTCPMHEMKAGYYRRGYCEMLIAAKITDGSAFQLLFSDILSKRSSQNRSTEL